MIQEVAQYFDLDMIEVELVDDKYFGYLSH